MAYAQWADFTMKTVGVTVTLKNVVHQWGKFYTPPNKDDEISVSDVEGTKVAPGAAYRLGACGRSDAAAGTEGGVDFYDGKTLIASYHWDCPWGSKTNTSTLTMHDDENYVVQVTGANLDSGALGNISIKIVKI